jgi:hypothetical protein
VQYRRLLVVPIVWLVWICVTAALVAEAKGESGRWWALASTLVSIGAVVYVVRPLRALSPLGVRAVRLHRWADIDHLEIGKTPRTPAIRLRRRGRRKSTPWISQRFVVGDLVEAAESAAGTYGIDLLDNRKPVGWWKRLASPVVALVAIAFLGLISQWMAVPGVWVERPGEVVDAHDRLRGGGPVGSRGEILILAVHEGPAFVNDVLFERGDATRFRWYNPLDPPADDAPDRADDRSAQNAAVAAAMGCIGRVLPFRNDGVEVGVVRPSGPAAGKVFAHERLVSVGGRPVSSKEEAYDALVGWDLGHPIPLAVVGDDGRARTEHVPVIRAEDGSWQISGVGLRRRTIEVGVPAPSLDLYGLTGDSDGLASAITILDAESASPLVAPGTRVAMTGSLSPGGIVGPIGGIEFKIAAAGRAKASVVLVPTTLADAALRAAPAGLRVVGVRTLNEAVVALGGSGCVPRTGTS